MKVVTRRTDKLYSGIVRTKSSNNTNLGVTSKKKNSIFKDIVQIGGREVNPMSKILKGMNF